MSRRGCLLRLSDVRPRWTRRVGPGPNAQGPDRRSLRVAVLVFVLVFFAGTSAADPGTTGYEAARNAYRALVNDGAEAREPSAWRRAAEGFRAVADRTPSAARADDALYMVGLCLERARALDPTGYDGSAAVAAYDRLAREYPASNLTDDALLRIGRLLEIRGDIVGARGAYRRVLDEAPEGDMVTLARRRLDGLGRTTRVNGIRHWSGPNYTRVVVDLSSSTAYEVHSLRADPEAGRPPRVFVNLNNAVPAPGVLGRHPVADGNVRQVRVARFDADTMRVVLDLKAPVTFRAFPLDAPPRLVIDLFRETPDVVGDLIAEVHHPPSTHTWRVVVDPGHGGKDPGAVGARGLHEKDLTLAIALELARSLRKRPGFEVQLTRDRDVYLSLEQRTAIANAFEADLFVSVHVNASRSKRVQGIETYYLDRASDRAARKLAARENKSREDEVTEMEHILTDVLLNSKVGESKRLARALQDSLVGELSSTYGSVRDLGVKKGPFYVLTGAVMPAVLVETAFITHPVEARRLADAGFRRRAAEALADGVAVYTRSGRKGS